MKTNKKTKNILMILFTLLIVTFSCLTNNAYATSNSAVSLKVVSDKKASIDLNNLCNFEKSLYNFDKDKKQVTIQLKINNNADMLQPQGEVMLVLDNSNSMTDTTSTGAIRKDLVYASANTLIDKILSNNSNVKVGVVSFSTNSDISKEGTINDAELISNLSTNASSLKTAISNITPDGVRTDLDSGITLAQKSFTNSASKKYIIVLTDGVPNVALGYNNPYYSDGCITATKTTLQNLSSSNINLITMLTGITNGDSLAAGTQKTYNQIINEIFGTTQSPTYGKFYYINDSDVENTIKTSIYNDLLPVEQKITNITVKDYFPQYIIDNFDFAYVDNPTGGTISSSIDKKDNSITWTIPTLTNHDSFNVKYTLTLKSEFNSEIIGKVLNTNDKIETNYTDFDNTSKSKSSQDTPQIQVDLNQFNYTINHYLNDSSTPFATQSGTSAPGTVITADDYSSKYTLVSTVTTLTISDTGENILNVYWKAPTILPNTGLKSALPILLILALSLGIFSFIKLKKYSEK